MASRTIGEMSLKEFQKALSNNNFGRQNMPSDTFTGYNEDKLNKAFRESIKATEAAYDNLFKAEEEKHNKLLATLESNWKRYRTDTTQYDRARLSEIFDWQEKQEKIIAEKKRKIAEIESKKELAIKKAKENEYLRASLNDKLQLTREQRKADDEELNAINLKIKAHQTLTDSEMKRRKDLSDAIKKYDEQELNLIKAKTDARLKNVPVEQKLADLQDRLNDRNRVHKESKTKYDEDIAAIEISEGSEKDKDNARRQAKKEYDSREEKADAEYGVKVGEGLGKTFKNVAGQIFGEGEDKDILGGVESIINGNLGNVVSDAIEVAVPGIGTIIKVLTTIMGVISAGFKKLDEGVEMYATLEKEYLGSVNSRLDGTGLTYQLLTEYFSQTFGSNPYFNQKSLVETMAQLAEAGISYNLEQRTILADLSDRMVSTFDMLDTTLTRLTRLEQADLSTTALGSESILTQFLNTYFQDTSYLSDEYDTVAGALTEALSQMSAQDATSFNYAVQKWLGALYSLGMSSSGVNTLAEGINALATGDVDYFNSNDSARTLFALASNGSYADLLVNGVNATNVNSLLQNIVNYLASISTDTNQVTKNVKAGIYGGLSLSDIRAVSNLTTSDVSAISNSNVTWDSAKSQVSDYLIDFAQSNTQKATQLDNILQNTLYNLGETIVDNEDAYTLWSIGDILGDNTFGDAVRVAAVASLGWGGMKDLAKNTFKGLGNLLSWATGSSNSDIANLLSMAGDQSIVAQLVNDQNLIKQRGSSYAGTSGILSGISVSNSLNLGGNTTASSTTGSTDNYLTQSLYEQSSTVQNASSGYTDYTSTISRDIDDIYRALFEDQLAIRVIVASVEDQAQKDLTNQVYRVNENELVSIVDDVQDATSAIYNGITNWAKSLSTTHTSVEL